MTTQSLAEAVVAAAGRAGLTVATAESCTGGMIAAALTDVPGASAVFTHGVVAYANDAKSRVLDVPPDLIDAHGAVSEAVAKGMVAGVAALANADLAVSVTGIAGPGGGTPQKPVGLVWFGLSRGGAVTAYREVFDGPSRAAIRQAATVYALALLADAV